MRSKSVQRPILEAHRHDADAFTLVHDQIERKVFDEKLHVVLQRGAVKRVQHGVTRTIGRRGATVRLATFAEVERLTAERSLINFAVVCARKRQTVVFELDDSLGRFAAHVLNRILVTEPISPFHRVVGVPAPIILSHVAQRRVDSALRSDGVRARREELRHACGFKAVLAQTDRRTKSGATGADDQRIVLVVNHLVITEPVRLRGRGRRGRRG